MVFWFLRCDLSTPKITGAFGATTLFSYWYFKCHRHGCSPLQELQLTLKQLSVLVIMNLQFLKAVK